jgi:hypothetical protein
MNKYVLTAILTVIFTVILIKGTSDYAVKGANLMYDETAPTQGYDLKPLDMQTASLTPVEQHTGSLIDQPGKSNENLPSPSLARIPTVAEFKPPPSMPVPPDVKTMLASAPF